MLFDIAIVERIKFLHPHHIFMQIPYSQLVINISKFDSSDTTLKSSGTPDTVVTTDTTSTTESADVSDTAVTPDITSDSSISDVENLSEISQEELSESSFTQFVSSARRDSIKSDTLTLVDDPLALRVVRRPRGLTLDLSPSLKTFPMQSQDDDSPVPFLSGADVSKLEDTFKLHGDKSPVIPSKEQPFTVLEKTKEGMFPPLSLGDGSFASSPSVATRKPRGMTLDTQPTKEKFRIEALDTDSPSTVSDTQTYDEPGKMKKDIIVPLPSSTRFARGRKLSRVEVPDKAVIQDLLAKMENEDMHRYIKRFTFDYPKCSLEEALSLIFSDESVTTREMSVGKFGAKFVMTQPKEKEGETPEEPVCKSVLKKSTVPPQLFEKHFGLVERHLCQTRKVNFREQVEDVFVKKPMGLLNQTQPFYSAIHREKLADVVSTHVKAGVPLVSTLRCKDGHYSLHEHVKGQTSFGSIASTTPLNVQSLQRVGLLDIILGNPDRNGGNLLVLDAESDEEGRVVVPIDHAQVLQRDILETIGNEEVNFPCWLKRAEANEPLTTGTRAIIAGLDVREITKDASKAGLVMSDGDRMLLAKNIKYLQDTVLEKPTITLKELGAQFFGKEDTEVVSVKKTDDKGPPVES